MDVYLVPVGRDRHELYCEVPDSPDDVRQEQEPEDESPGFFGRLRKRVRFARLRGRFAEMLAEAERERHQPHAVKPETGWAGRMKRRTLRLVAETIAEQRLLWLLRKETEARLYYPDDLDGHAAMGIVRSQLGRDFDTHRFWMIVDTLGFIGSGLLALVRSIEASRPFASISILESIERDAAVRAARMRALSTDASVKPLEATLTRRQRAA